MILYRNSIFLTQIAPTLHITPMKRIDYALMVAVLFMFVAPAVLSQTSASSALSPTILATGQNYADSLFIYKGFAYWGSYANTITKVPITGGTVSQVATKSPAFVVYGKYIYYDNGGGSYGGGGKGIYRVSVNGGASKLLATCFCYLDPRIYANYIYFINDAKSSPSIEKVPIVGGKPALVYQGSYSVSGENPIQISISQSYIYWIDNLGGIGKVPLTGGTGQVLFAGRLCQPNVQSIDSTMLVLNNGFIYWTVNLSCGISASVNKLSISGGAVTTLFASLTTGFANGLGYNSGKIIFTYYDGVTNPSGIYSVSTSGGVSKLLVSSPLPVAVAILSGKVYYTDLSLGTVNVFTP